MAIITAPGTGGLWFKTDPEGATLIIDDQMYSETTPTAINNIPPGPHQFTIRLAGYEDVSDLADVIEGRMCCIELNLDTTEKAEACSIQPIPETGPPAPPAIPSAPIYVIQKPDYTSVILGLFAGIILAAIIFGGFGRKKDKE